MFISIVDSHTPALNDHWELKSLVVRSEVTQDALGRSLAVSHFGSLSHDGEHAWLNVETLEEQVHKEDRERWSAAFAKVLEYAESQGWTNKDRSQVRAHVEYVNVS